MFYFLETMFFQGLRGGFLPMQETLLLIPFNPYMEILLDVI